MQPGDFREVMKRAENRVREEEKLEWETKSDRAGGDHQANVEIVYPVGGELHCI
jgi:hypothetical protein